MSQDSTLFVGNIDSPSFAEDGEALLVELFSQCGGVKSVRIPTDNGRPKGFAFVEMANLSAATYACLALNGFRLYGRNLRVACAMDNEKEVLLRLENIPVAFCEIDLFEALSHRVAVVRGVSLRRNHNGRSEGKATVWFDSATSMMTAKQTLMAQPLFLDSVRVRVA
jgi:hypothetical protein